MMRPLSHYIIGCKIKHARGHTGTTKSKATRILVRKRRCPWASELAIWIRFVFHMVLYYRLSVIWAFLYKHENREGGRV